MACAIALLAVGAALAAEEKPKPIDLFVAGAEDIEGVANAAEQYPQYREQAVVVTRSGTVVAICQGRNQSSWSDRSGQDLVCKHSTDSGLAWSKGRLIVTHGDKSVCPNAAVYDRTTGRIHAFYTLFEWPYTDAESRKTWKGQKRTQYHLWSDDGGETWQRGKPVDCGACETAIAELPDGTLLANNRGRRGFRRRSVSTDQGATWTELREDKALRSVSCNGSLIAVKHPKGKQGVVLLCSAPVGPKRTHGTVYISLDWGETWPAEKLVVEGSFAYSSLVELPDGTIGLFYESADYRLIRLVKLTRGWLIP